MDVTEHLAIVPEWYVVRLFCYFGFLISVSRVGFRVLLLRASDSGYCFPHNKMNYSIYKHIKLQLMNMVKLAIGGDLGERLGEIKGKSIKDVVHS